MRTWHAFPTKWTRITTTIVWFSLYYYLYYYNVKLTIFRLSGMCHNDLLWSQETIANTLLERRGGGRRAKVVEAGHGSSFSERGGQTDDQHAAYDDATPGKGTYGREAAM